MSHSRTIAQLLVVELNLVKGKEYIRFKETSKAKLDAGVRTMLLKYGKDVPAATLMVHTASFMKNPLRYIFQMIDNSNTSEKKKKLRRKQVDEVVRRAMKEDPLGTVQTIVYSMARYARF